MADHAVNLINVQLGVVVLGYFFYQITHLSSINPKPPLNYPLIPYPIELPSDGAMADHAVNHVNVQFIGPGLPGNRKQGRVITGNYL